MSSAKILIYILTYSNETLNIAKKMYGHNKWAKFVILPPTILFENYMYDEWLPNNYDDWKDYDYVGTLSWKAETKVLLPDINKLANFLFNNKFDVIPFYVIDDRNLLNCIDIRQPNNKKILKILFEELGGYNNNFINNNFIEFYCNYWIATPKVMLDYIQVFKKCKNIINSNQDIQKLLWSYIEYISELDDEMLLQIFGQLKYSYHPFIYERIPYLYLSKYNIAHPYILYTNGLYPKKKAEKTNNILFAFWKNNAAKFNNRTINIAKKIELHELHFVDNFYNKQIIINPR
jgi:hypothetical protein